MIEIGEVELTRKCSLLRWLDGRFVTKQLRPAHVREWGRLMARFHNHAAGWRLPKGFTRRHRDWPGLYGEGAGFEAAFRAAVLLLNGHGHVSRRWHASASS